MTREDWAIRFRDDAVERAAIMEEGFRRVSVVNRRAAPFDIYIGRPSPWGNPFSHKPDTLAEYRVETREQAIEEYRKWLLAQPELVARAYAELPGKVLGCWCKPASCHGDVLAEIVNAQVLAECPEKARLDTQRCREREMQPQGALFGGEA